MAISTKSFTDLVTQQVAAIQGAASSLIDLTIGSVLRALVEAVAAVALWLQGMILQLLAATRAATSSGTDLDTWMADFGLTRLAAVAASGNVTFARFTTSLQAVIPIGATVQTADGSQVFAVTLDTTNPAYSSTLGGYVIAVGVSSVVVPVMAAVAGGAGNISAGQLNTITQAMPGVDTVSNALAYANGVDAETDTAFRARFALYISGLRAGIKEAVASAIAGMQQGIQYSLVENNDYSGNTQNGYFYVVINPSGSTLQSDVYTAIDAIRPLSVTFGVFPATTLTANIVLTATAASGYTHAQIVTAITTAIQDFIAGLGLAKPLYWSQLYAVAYGVAGVQEVTGLTVNGGTVDLAATAKQVIISGTVTVN